MAIKINIPDGQTNVTVAGLYQWDYGQVLEIECPEIGSETLEVHFACPNMSEAIVRTCTFTVGVGTVTIPDECLEQANLVTAWLCQRDSTQRRTLKTITLPLTARTRPGNMLDDIPPSRADVIGQLIEEVNEAVDAIESGKVTAAKAQNAANATYAQTAGSATSATYATSAGSAGTATTATTATTANTISPKRAVTATVTNGVAKVNRSYLKTQTLYLVVLKYNYSFFASGIFIISGAMNYSSLGLYNLYCQGDSTDTSKYSISITGDSSNTNGEISFYEIGGTS